MVDVINLDDITYEQFVNNYLYLNKPCLIKNFTNNYCDINTINKYTKNEDIQKKYKIGNIDAYSNTYEEICNNFIIENIKNDKNILLNKKSIRIWKHNKNNLTKWHYDGNGVDIFNISIQGLKEFYLSKPGSIDVYPLSNIGYYHIDSKEEYKIILNPGEMLYIPAFWFHKVITLKDDTININYFFVNKYPITNNRNHDNLLLHKAFNTNMNKSNIIIVNNNHILRSLLYGFYETLPFFILFYILFLKFNKIKYILLVAGIYLILNKDLATSTSGISELYGIYFIFYYLIIEHMSKIILNY
jgi:hypothetical protein